MRERRTERDGWRVMLWSSGLHTWGCGVNKNTVQNELRPWPSGRRSKAATARWEQEKEMVICLPLGMRREQQEPAWPISELEGAEGLRFPPAQWGAEMEAGLGEGQGRGRGPACQDLCFWCDPSIRQVLKSHGQDYLVGNKLSRADIHLVELLYYVEELDPSLLANFPLLKVSSPMALGARHTPTLASALWTLGLGC